MPNDQRTSRSPTTSLKAIALPACRAGAVPRCRLAGSAATGSSATEFHVSQASHRPAHLECS